MVSFMHYLNIPSSMDIEFLGGASKVGSLGMTLKLGGARLLFDYGITPTNPPAYPARASAVDAVLLSHAHVDHSGMIPWYSGRYETPVYATAPTIDIGLMLMEDTLKVSDSEGYPLPYGRGDIRAAARNFHDIEFNDPFDVGGLEIIPHSAGHIPGATMWEVNSDRTLLFTGDINDIETRLVGGCEAPKCDVLVVESTYAGRNHPDRLKTEYSFLKKVDEVVGRGGVAVVPAFAVGRTQELAMVLSQCDHQVWLDGLGKRVNEVYLDYPEYLTSAKKLRRAVTKAQSVKNIGARKRAVQGDVIVTTSGMLDGGPALGYIEAIKDDPKSAILLTGYQVEGTNGRKLRDTGKLNFQGVEEDVKCEVGFFDFSAHADHRGLVSTIKKCDPETIVLMHGDQREVLAKDLGGYEVLMPVEKEKITI